jgi:hypothetical protein
MASNKKTRSVERAEAGSHKLDKALEAVLNADLMRAQAVWKEDRSCRRKLSRLSPANDNPIATEAAKIEIESLKKQAGILSNFGGQQRVLSGDGSGILSMHDPALFSDYSIADFSACSERDFSPPYPRGYAWGLPTAPGVDGVMTANRKTGDLAATCRIFNNGGSLKVTAGFWIDFHLNVPLFNPKVQIKPPLRFGRMRVVADFAPMQTSWIVAARELFASSSGSILITVATDPGPWPLWYTSRLWKRSAVNTDEYNPLRDATYASSRVFTSPYFGADSMTRYSAYVGVSVDVEGDVDLPQYAFAYGSIAGVLSSVRIQQCLVP